MDRGAWWAKFYGVTKDLDMTKQLTQIDLESFAFIFWS